MQASLPGDAKDVVVAEVRFLMNAIWLEGRHGDGNFWLHYPLGAAAAVRRMSGSVHRLI